MTINHIPSGSAIANKSHSPLPERHRDQQTRVYIAVASVSPESAQSILPFIDELQTKVLIGPPKPKQEAR